jgi:LuxR family maltose regulon positive regulatory protein
VVAAFLLGTIARGALGDPDAAGRALQSALDLAEPDQVLFPFLIDPPPGLFDRHARHHILGIGQYHAEHARGHL